MLMMMLVFVQKSAEQTARVLGTTLWASETNTIWAIYWLIAASLTQPEGLRPLVAEIDASRSKYIKDHPEADILREILHDADANVDTDATCHWINSTSSADLPLLTATIQEVIRLYASGFSKRRVTQSTTLGGHVLEEGQDVLVVARSVHLDEDIHEDAAKWKPSRYLNTKSTDSTGSESLGGKKYRKDGKIVPNHSMPWGGGVSMCEGRYVTLLPLISHCRWGLT
jgi:cytochrome P450